MNLFQLSKAAHYADLQGFCLQYERVFRSTDLIYETVERFREEYVLFRKLITAGKSRLLNLQQDKQDRRSEIADQILPLCRIAAYWAKTNHQYELLHVFNVTEAQLTRSHDYKAIGFCMDIIEELNNHRTSLSKISSADIEKSHRLLQGFQHILEEEFELSNDIAAEIKNAAARVDGLVNRIDECMEGSDSPALMQIYHAYQELRKKHQEETATQPVLV